VALYVSFFLFACVHMFAVFYVYREIFGEYTDYNTVSQKTTLI